jgi:RNA polymerase sigma-70 factor (ECF subfamily)
MNALLPLVARSRSEPPVSSAQSFANVYRTYVHFVFRSARALGVHPPAVDDVVQEVFVVVHKRLGELREHSNLRSWISRILVNVVRHQRRTFARKSPQYRSCETPGNPDDLPNCAADPCEALALSEQARLVQRLLDSLDDDKREILVLAEMEELSVREIAEALGLKLNTAYSRLRLARRAFDEALARDGARDDRRMR